MLNVTLLGLGAIGRSVLELTADDEKINIEQVLTTPRHVEALTKEFPDKAIATQIKDLPKKPELIIEVAGHKAIVEHILPALEQGITCIVCSIGALSTAGLPEQLESAAQKGETKLELISGAIGGIDALAAAQVGGLEKVIYTGRKPPTGWTGTPAEDKLDLEAMTEAAVFFEGSAREAARLFPKNANVAATVSLAGLGLDKTQVSLIADPSVDRNNHHVQAFGAFGEFAIKMAGKTLPSNPKTSALTVYSAVRALKNRAHAVAI